ncbi:hypothetical protein M0P65_02360 [Candidatus Gracilibacteria bacterium]|nr:hypothetical protein [Candidatus Gracilibacteria bacterium]
MVNTPNPANTGKQEIDTTGELQVEQTTRKNVAQILFNPSDPKYKKVEDLPRAFRDDFINTEDETGFVRKDADKHFMEAQRQADKNIRHGKTEGINAVDILYDKMFDEEEASDKIIAGIIKGNVFDGFKEEREIDEFIGNYNATKGYTLGMRSKKILGTKNITNELYERKILTKNFFMKIVEGGVCFFRIYDSIPKELRNDEEFLLKLAEKTNTEISLGFISKKILEEKGNDFLFKLIEVGGRFSNEETKNIIDKYFADKDHLLVIDYLNKNNTEVSKNTDKIYLAIIEKFKNNRSIKDILEIMFKLYPEVAYNDIFRKSYELKSIALEILMKIKDRDVNEIIKYLGK